MTRCLIGLLITLALGLLVALGGPSTIMRVWRGLGRDTAFFGG